MISQKQNDIPAGADKDLEEAPPVLKRWKNLYLLVLANLVFWILLLTLFTLIFK